MIYINMKKPIFTTVSLLLLTTITVIAQVRLQSDQIDQVLKAMTLEEKAMLVVGGNLRTENQENNGMVGSHSHLVPGAAGMTRAIERLARP